MAHCAREKWGVDEDKLCNKAKPNIRVRIEWILGVDVRTKGA
jgi:hypothetical protein